MCDNEVRGRGVGGLTVDLGAVGGGTMTLCLGTKGREFARSIRVSGASLNAEAEAPKGTSSSGLKCSRGSSLMGLPTSSWARGGYCSSKKAYWGAMANRLSGCGGSVGRSLSLVDRSAMLLQNEAKFGSSGNVALEVKKVGVATSSLFGRCRVGNSGWKGVDV